MPAKSGAGLTDLQQRFVEEYLKDLNATAAAIRAGYSERTANNNASRLMVNDGIAAAIQAAMQERSERVKITTDDILRQLAALCLSNHMHYQVDDNGNLSLAPNAPESAHLAIASVKHKIRTHEGRVEREVEYRLWSKTESLRLAMQHMGMLVNKHELTGKDGKPLLPEKAMEAVTKYASYFGLIEGGGTAQAGPAATDDHREPVHSP